MDANGYRIELDLGHDHRLRFSQYEGAIVGAIVEHLDPQGQPCSGAIMFDVPEAHTFIARDNRSRPLWTVQAWQPLSLDPSVLCQCGDHGHIKDDRWIPA